MNTVRARGRSFRRNYTRRFDQIPAGNGRLIRGMTLGKIVILDSRIVTKTYGPLRRGTSSRNYKKFNRHNVAMVCMSASVDKQKLYKSSLVRHSDPDPTRLETRMRASRANHRLYAVTQV